MILGFCKLPVRLGIFDVTQKSSVGPNLFLLNFLRRLRKVLVLVLI